MTAARFVLCAAVLPACGLAARDEPLEPPTTDGTSGWVFAGPVEVCLGPARIVGAESASGAGAVGVCAPQDAEPRACGGAAGCRPPEQCICGRCAVRGCRSVADCGQGMACKDGSCARSCRQDAECESGEVCSIGGCARRCAAASDCGFGQRCDATAGTCRGQACDEAVACPPGSKCFRQEAIGEVHEPSVLGAGPNAVAYVEVRGDASAAPGGAVYRARVETADRWVVDPIAPVLAPAPGEDGGRVGAPSARRRGTDVEIYAATGDGRIVRARSGDGVAFVRDPVDVAAPAAPWEAGALDSPSVVDASGRTWVFYEAGGAIGVVRVDAPGVAASRVQSGPWLTAADVEDPLLWRAIERVGAPSAVAVGDVVRVYFTGRGIEGSDAVGTSAVWPADPNDSIGLVATRDPAGARKDRFPGGPVLARRANLRAYLGEREPDVRVDPGASSIVFVSSTGEGAGTSGLARATSR